MKLIITESQKEKVLRNLIKKNGVEFTSNIVGGTENLFNVLNIETPMDFLHLFDDLERVQSEDKSNWDLFRNKSKHNLMIYDRKKEEVYINYIDIWAFLEYKFGLRYSEINPLIKEWLDEVYNLRGVTILSSLQHYF